MGRRALRKIDPLLDLSRHYFELESEPLPLELARLLPRRQPLEIEVGSGKGLYLANASEARPDHDFLGIEIARKYARYSAARLAREDRDNAVMLQGDANRLFAEGLGPAVACAVHVYFPDPWWKKRHRKRRIMNPTFVREVIRVLQPGGLLHFWTDVREYYEVTLEMLHGFPELAGPEIPPELEAAHDLDYRTHFERRTRLHDLPVYRSRWIRAWRLGF